MKKFLIAAMSVAALTVAMSSCNSSNSANDTVITADTLNVEGSVVDMPTDPEDTTVIAEGMSVAVEPANSTDTMPMP